MAQAIEPVGSRAQLSPCWILRAVESSGGWAWISCSTRAVDRSNVVVPEPAKLRRIRAPSGVTRHVVNESRLIWVIAVLASAASGAHARNKVPQQGLRDAQPL